MDTFLEASERYLPRARQAVEEELGVALGQIDVIYRTNAATYVPTIQAEKLKALEDGSNISKDILDRIAEHVFLSSAVTSLMYWDFLCRQKYAAATIITPERSLIISSTKKDRNRGHWTNEEWESVVHHEVCHIGLVRYGCHKKHRPFAELHFLPIELTEGFAEVAAQMVMEQQGKPYMGSSLKTYLSYRQALVQKVVAAGARTAADVADIVVNETLSEVSGKVL